MKITLDQVEIEDAVRDYVMSQVSVKDGQRIEMDFTAGRGANGLTVDINIVRDTSAVIPTPATKSTTTRSSETQAVKEVKSALTPEPVSKETNEEAPVEATKTEPKATSIFAKKAS